MSSERKPKKKPFSVSRNVCLYYNQDTWVALEWNKISAGIEGLGRDCVTMSLENHIFFFPVFEFSNKKKKKDFWQREEWYVF